MIYILAKEFRDYTISDIYEYVYKSPEIAQKVASRLNEQTPEGFKWVVHVRHLGS